MAATQAESQLNDTNREHLHEKPSEIGNSTFQNGTEKNGSKNVGSDGGKVKFSTHNYSADMSQERQENCGPSMHNEQNDECGAKHNSEKAYLQNIDNGSNEINYNKGLPESANAAPNVQNYLPYSPRSNYSHPDHSSQQMNSTEGGNTAGSNANSNNMHQNSVSNQYGNMANVRHNFPNSKPGPGPRPMAPHMNTHASNFNPHGHPQRFMSGQSISQQMGPTPTLNQLLQSSNPVHRYQNNYSEYANQKPNENPQAPFNHGWNTRPMPPYMNQQGYRGQMPNASVRCNTVGVPPGPGGGPYSHQPPPGGSVPGPPPAASYPSHPQPSSSPSQQPPGGPPGPPQQYQPYPQRYPTPSGPPQQAGPVRVPAYPAPHPQMVSPYGPMSQGPPNMQGGGSPYPGEQRLPWPPMQQQQPGPPPPQQQQQQQQQQQPPPPPQQGPPPPPQPVPQQQQQPNSQSPQQQNASQASHIPPNSPVPPAPSTPTPHSASSTPQQHSPQSTLTSPQSVHPEASPQQTHQPQQSPQHSSQSFGPSRPNLTSTPEPGDLTSQNSNDSSSSGGPQAMRPTPSPTGSTGSRSMSPAIGAYPGRGVQSMPPYHQSYGMQQPGAGSHSQYPARPMPNHVPHSQFPGFQGWPAPNVSVSGPSPGQMSMSGPGAPWPTNHVSGGGGGGGPGKGVPPPASSPQQSQQPPQPPGTPHQANQQQHHPMHHMQQPPQQQQQPPSQPQPTPPPQSPQQQPPPPQSPQSQQQQSPQMGQNCSPGPRSHTPPQYLKQHLQHKVGFNNSSGMPPSPGPPPGMYGNSSPGPGMGPPHHHPMGPPVPAGHHPHMGPGMGHPNMQNMMPPHNSHHDSPMPPPSSTPNSHSLPTPPIQSDASMDGMHEGGAPLTTTASGNMTNVSQINSGGITSVVTTGPDGAPMDEASQQSTLSNTSAASGEDPSSTPKRKESGMGMMGPMGGYLGHGHSQGPVPPCSPGMNSMHDDYPSEGNAPWSRTPSSPVFNSHMSQDIYRSKKHDSLGKLYEMDDSPERRVWVDKLLHFMEERGSPIPTCPTISKNPLDLFRLYVYVKERGGFVEVTKNKIWKDIAGLLGIGASSSAAYTLRKHYTKHLLPFECRFDRGGIDPQPIINQMESSTKKKNAKNASVPSPGSSNSQDSFPSGPGGGMDGYGGYGYSSEYGNQRGPPTMQSNQGMSSQPGGYQSQPGYNQYPPDQYGQQYVSGGSYPPSRPMYPVYPPDGERGYSQNSSSNAMGPSTGPQQQSAPSPAVSQGPSGADPYSRSPYGQPMYHPRPPFSGPGQPPQQPPSSTSQTSNSHVVPSPPRPDSQPSPSPYPPSPQQPPSQSQTSQPPSQQHIPSQQPQQPPGPPQQPPHQPPPQAPNQASQPPGAPQQQQPPTQIPPSQSPHDFYRPDQPYLNQNHIPSPGSGTYPGPGGPNKGMPPPPVQQSRRHPDFTKDSQQSPPPSSYSPYNNQQQRPMFPGWPQENSNRNQYVRGPYPQPQAVVPPNAPPQQWGQSPMPRPSVPPNAQPPPNAQWEQHRYPPNSQQQSFPPPQPGQWNMQSGGPPMVQNSNLRPPRANFRDKPFPPMPPSQAVKTMPPGQVPPQATFASSAAAAALKREPIFPADSVEAVTPLMYKRKRLTKNDVAPVDAWKLMMSLRSGLLTETCWALDVLNILLFDDTGVQYFGLAHLPGLLDILLEHFNRSLNDMLENAAEREDRRWYEKPWRECTEPDLGRVTEPIDNKDRLPLKTNLPDYSMKSRRGSPVATVDGTDDLFVKDGPRRWEDGPISIEDVVEPDSRYIVSCFRSEFGIVPFARLLPEIKNKCKKRKSDTNTDSDINHRTKTEEKPDLIIKSEPVETTVKSEPMDDESNASVKNEPDKKEDEADEAEALDVEDKLKENNCKLNDPMGTLKRRKLSQYEDECYTRDEASLYLITDTQDAIARRCICLSTILRNLTFIPGNECEFSKNSGYLALMGKLLLIHHEHPLRTQKQQNYDREDDTDFSDCCSSLQGESEWWWDFLHQIRENVLVSIANIAGYVDLSNYLEEVSRPILDGLLHWAVCPAAQGQDPFPTASSLSPQKLALEALCKLCVTDANVDLVIATPPYSRLGKLTTVLTRLLCRSEEQVLREFAINLLHYLAAAESSMSRIIALQSPCISLLVAFIEQAEQSALGVANQHGINALRDNPESMGTSLDMLRRAARTLLHLSRHPDNKPLFLQQEQRLLALVMSQILDQQVAGIISQVLYQCSRSPSPTWTS